MRQEIVLGIGGVQALSALGIDAEVFHMNEGHSAFLSLERIRRHVAEKKLDFYSALQVVAAGEYFHHAHAGAGGERRVPARDDAAILRRVRRGNSDCRSTSCFASARRA